MSRPSASTPGVPAALPCGLLVLLPVPLRAQVQLAPDVDSASAVHTGATHSTPPKSSRPLQTHACLQGRAADPVRRGPRVYHLVGGLHRLPGLHVQLLLRQPGSAHAPLLPRCQWVARLLAPPEELSRPGRPPWLQSCRAPSSGCTVHATPVGRTDRAPLARLPADCLAMPHLAHSGVGAVCALVYLGVVLGLVSWLGAVGGGQGQRMIAGSFRRGPGRKSEVYLLLASPSLSAGPCSASSLTGHVTAARAGSSWPCTDARLAASTKPCRHAGQSGVLLCRWRKQLDGLTFNLVTLPFSAGCGCLRLQPAVTQLPELVCSGAALQGGSHQGAGGPAAGSCRCRSCPP
jgi:hypothetical protein